jgi:CheY-like chemotaxis protein
MTESVSPPRPRILVVEDEFLIRLTLVEALGDEGYDVIEAESGDAGLVLLQNDTAIQLLLTDIQLPGMLDGRALAQRARQDRPNLPILFMTGRPDPANEAGAAPNDRYIAKPYTLNDMCEAVRGLLAETTAG